MVRGALEALPFVSLLFLDVVEHLGICLAQTAGRLGGVFGAVACCQPYLPTLRIVERAVGCGRVA